MFYLLFLFGIFYFLLIRPQQQRTKRHRELVLGLRDGDKVVTVGGIYGTIKQVTDDTISLEIADKVIVVFSKASVARRL
ncbi:MAG TPA: preprotein translocase subunit YajC [Actinobacteria bacterium]|nr:preprotein translocase subunit YajC [Actinomycetota bacterium]